MSGRISVGGRSTGGQYRGRGGYRGDWGRTEASVSRWLSLMVLAPIDWRSTVGAVVDGYQGDEVVVVVAAEIVVVVGVWVAILTGRFSRAFTSVHYALELRLIYIGEVHRGICLAPWVAWQPLETEMPKEPRQVQIMTGHWWYCCRFAMAFRRFKYGFKKLKVYKEGKLKISIIIIGWEDDTQQNGLSLFFYCFFIVIPTSCLSVECLLFFDNVILFNVMMLEGH